MRFAFFALATFIFGCGAAAPPMIADEDGGPEQTHPETKESPAGACDTPSENCPCTDVGAQVSCGLVYRFSGDHVDCSPGYLTCKDDGKWSACVGDAIWDGG